MHCSAGEGQYEWGSEFSKHGPAQPIAAIGAEHLRGATVVGTFVGGVVKSGTYREGLGVASRGRVYTGTFNWRGEPEGNGHLTVLGTRGEAATLATLGLQPLEHFEGDFARGKPHGRGIYTWEDGRRYVGDVVDGVCTGEGSLCFPNGSVYTGTVVNAMRHGQGQMMVC